MHPASKQRSEGEKVRVGDDLILVSVATERYLVSGSNHSDRRKEYGEHTRSLIFNQFFDDAFSAHGQRKCSFDCECFLSCDSLVGSAFWYWCESNEIRG